MKTGRLNLYLLFHMNLAFSSIREDERKTVIENCYYPLLELSEKYDIFPGIELSGYTLETIEKIEPQWIKRFIRLLENRRCELIGSGYSQLIGPLVPFEVNNMNMRLGIKSYNEILGHIPEIFLINEMAYSSGLLDSLKDNCKAFIMEWNNPWRYKNEWNSEFRYYPQIALGNNKTEIPVIWSDSIAFQKFQRYVNEDIDIDEYLNYLKLQKSEDERFFPLYSNDVEIFDFRPGRYMTESELKKNEWKRIEELIKGLLKVKEFNFVRPVDVLKGLNLSSGGNKIVLESPNQPIPVKKQEKYNINRWALTGRDDHLINTNCYKIYNELINKNGNSEEWKKLCYLWSSDFRTHIGYKRWEQYLEELFREINKIKENVSELEDEYMKINIPCIKEDFICRKKSRYLEIENDKIKLLLNSKKGNVIDRCIFREISEKSIFGTLEHGYYDDISLGADFFSGHLIIQQGGKHKITDLKNTDSELYEANEKYKIISSWENEEIKVYRDITVSDEEIILFKRFKLNRRNYQIIHPFHFTMIPEAWDERSLYFKTHNGGKVLERFNLVDELEINHDDMLSSLISSKHGLGVTEGKLVIGDKEKELVFTHDPSISAMIPAISFRRTRNNKIFLRIRYSVQEIDETFKPHEFENIFNCIISIRCRRN